MTTNDTDKPPREDDVFKQARDEIEGRGTAPAKTSTVPKPKTPAAGPHAKAELTNEMATPGSGTLPDPDEDDLDATTG